MSGQLAVPVDPARDHLRGGAPDAAVTLVEYGDYECPYSRAAFRSIERVERRLGERLCFVFRQFPLREIHPHAQMAAEVAEEASAQGRFWEMSDALFRGQPALEPQDLRRYAREVGLDADQLDAALGDGRHRARIDADVAGGIRSGVLGTPTLFLDGALYEGSYMFDELVAALTSASSSEAIASRASRFSSTS
jgi:protein-disulfide isomerase